MKKWYVCILLAWLLAFSLLSSCRQAESAYDNVENPSAYTDRNENKTKDEYNKSYQAVNNSTPKLIQQYINGDYALLVPSKAFDEKNLSSISDEFAQFSDALSFNYKDIDYDGKYELILKNPEDGNAVVGVFNETSDAVECWLWDTVEQSCIWTLEDDGVFLESYYEGREEASYRRICFNADGQQGLVVDIGDDVPRCIIFSSYATLEKPMYDEVGTCTLTIYTMDDRQSPIQSLAASVYYESEAYKIYTDDLNFDGYLDIFYIYAKGNPNRYYRVFLWDPAQGVFCENEALEQLSRLSADEENEVVHELIGYGASGGEANYYRYIDGELTCVRRIAYEFYWGPFLSVEDYRDGELTTVFYESAPRDAIKHEDDGQIIWPEGKDREFSKWYDINYIGE